MSWISDLWQILEAIATLTNEVGRSNTEIRELRKDVNTLTLLVADLKKDVENQKRTTELTLNNYQDDINHVKESLAAKFDVLTTKLDAKVADFEHRLPRPSSQTQNRQALKSKSDE